MNRRLQQFLELEQLKPAQFADIMGIQRANVSHILSGRNKPSFEFIQKFLLKFPSVNPDWFLLGKGKPFREQDQPASPLPSDNGDLFSGQSGHIDIRTLKNPAQCPGYPPKRSDGSHYSTLTEHFRNFIHLNNSASPHILFTPRLSK